MSREISTQEQEEALNNLLAYPAIAESPMLQHFLGFVVRKTLAGDTQHLKEYVIATQVFNKPSSFDPRLDSIVRVHARRLREKLKEYYAGPGKDAPVWVVIQKGGYLPQFVRPDRHKPGRLGVWFWVALLSGVLLVVETIVLIVALTRRAVPPPGPGAGEARMLLAPFLASPHRTLLAFGNDLFLKDNDGNMFRTRSEPKLDLSSRTRLSPADLLLTPSFQGFGPFYLDLDYTGTGEAVCIALLVRYFTQHGKVLDVRASNLLNAQELRDSDVIFLGSPRENLFLDKMDMAMDFRFVRRQNPAGRPFMAIQNQRPRPGESPLYEARLAPASKNPAEVYALISFLPGHAPNSHFLVLAGQASAGTQAACEYLLSAQVERDLPGAWRSVEGMPPSYEVLLKTTIHDFSPTRAQYVTHHAKE
jgi:hypothetical protein